MEQKKRKKETKPRRVFSPDTRAMLNQTIRHRMAAQDKTAKQLAEEYGIGEYLLSMLKKTKSRNNDISDDKIAEIIVRGDFKPHILGVNNRGIKLINEWRGKLLDEKGEQGVLDMEKEEKKRSLRLLLPEWR